MADPTLCKGWYSRGYLPHFDASNILQSITLRLHDSVPAEVVEHWKIELAITEKTSPDGKKAIEFRRRIRKYEDAGHGACFLKNPRIAALMQNSLLYFDNTNYRLISWCIMPNHLHFLIETKPEHALHSIMHSLKSYSAHEANKVLRRTGRFWMPEYFDRYIRDERHFEAVLAYIENNPVKAGFCSRPEDWPFSSAGYKQSA